MRLVGLVAIYQRPNTSKAAPGHPKYLYSNVTYIPIGGLVCLVAIMDRYSRTMLAWQPCGPRRG